MNKTNPPGFDKSSIPPPPQRETVKYLPTPQRETLVYGARQCPCTTMTFILTRENGDSIRDTLMIGIDEHNGEPSTRLIIRGQFEANEIPGHLRWLADAIAQQVEERSSAVAEYVTCHKLRGGGK